MRRALSITCLAAAALAASAPAAGAQTSRIYDDFRDDGLIDTCAYSIGEIEQVAGSLPGDVEQYAPNFVEQLNGARQTIAGGGCEPQPAPEAEPEPEAAPAAAPPPPGPPQPRVEVADPPAPSPPARRAIEAAARAPAPPVSATTALRGGADAPTPIWLLAALAAAALLAGLGAIVAWFFGLSPERFTRPLAAATADAGGRGADAFAEFRDWLRIGR